ncbi:apolipoprotein A1/A4/E [Elysia marginata]|uniref:Apolipoprotein A1/A4/E n=1 Tax=Elysia marginata TaxID=1093978 RepID=A0AAV4GEX1_9GAST|nr:apolipoprotein A1/A4/E [Elysia marginata]
MLEVRGLFNELRKALIPSTSLAALFGKLSRLFIDIRLILTGPESRDFLPTGLDFTFDRDNQRVPGTRNTCGALICEEEIDVSNSSASDKDLGDSTVIFSSILSMSVFKKRLPTISDTMNNRRGVLLGLTSQSTTITRVSNGRKVDGPLRAGRAKLRVELVKRDDCSAEFVCQVKGVDSQGREVVSTTNLVQQQSQGGHQVYDRIPMPAVSLQVLTLTQHLTQLINGLENRMEDKISSLGNNVRGEIAPLQNKLQDKMSSLESNVKGEIASLENNVQEEISSLENRMEDKILSLGVNVKYETSALENKLEDKISSLENKIEDMQKDITTFEYRLINKLDILQNKLEKKIESNSNPNKVLQLDAKVSKTPTDFRSQAKTDIPEDTLDLMWQKFYSEQKIALKNVSEYFKVNSNNASALIAMERDLDLLKSYGQMILNETEATRKELTSDVRSRCVATQATDTPKPQPQVSVKIF